MAEGQPHAVVGVDVGDGHETLPRFVWSDVLTFVLTMCEDSYMNTNQVSEVRFTAKRAVYWNNGNRRWQGIARDTAMLLVQSGRAVDLTDAAHI